MKRYEYSMESSHMTKLDYLKCLPGVLFPFAIWAYLHVLEALFG